MAVDPQAPEYKQGIDQSGDRPKPQPVPATRARAGVTGHNVRYILAAALAAVIVAFVIVYLVYV